MSYEKRMDAKDEKLQYEGCMKEENEKDTEVTKAEEHEEFGTSPPLYDVQEAYPPQPHHDQAPYRTLHVYHEGCWMGSKTVVKDTDKATVLYNVKLRFRKPQMIFESAISKETVGTVINHWFNSRLDATVNGRTVTIDSKGVFKDGFTFVSSAFNNATMTWKSQRRFKYLNLLCLDENEVPIARFNPSKWSIKKVGTLELFGARSSSGNAMDELVITGLAVLDHRQRQLEAAGNAAGVAGNVGGAGG